MQLPAVPLPPADPAPATVLRSWPDGTFLENLAFGPDGALWVTAYAQGELHRLTPGTWESEVVLRPGFHPLGIAFDDDGSALLSGHRVPGFDPRPEDAPDGFWSLGPDGEVAHVADAPGARFLNGVARLAPGRFACADSSGHLWVVDRAAGEARIVTSDPLIGPEDPALPLPAANGIKVHDGRLLVSNWVRGLLLRAPVDDPAALEVVADGLIVDDFAVAADGAVFGATHLDTVVRLDPDGGRRTIAGPEEGVRGCTACAFDPAGGTLYVVTDGGFVAGTPEPGRLVALEVGREGAPLR